MWLLISSLVSPMMSHISLKRPSSSIVVKEDRSSISVPTLRIVLWRTGCNSAFKLRQGSNLWFPLTLLRGITAILEKNLGMHISKRNNQVKVQNSWCTIPETSKFTNLQIFLGQFVEFISSPAVKWCEVYCPITQHNVPGQGLMSPNRSLWSSMH